MNPTPPATHDDGPLSPEQQKDLVQATERAHKVFGAVKVATFNGWTIGIFAGITGLFALFGSVTALVMGAGMAVVSWNEFRGRTRLRQFDPQGPRLLGRNQVGFMSLLVGYCLWSIYRTVTNPVTEVLGLEEIAGIPADVVTSLTVSVYLIVIVLSLLFQGLNALYYFRRIKPVEDYLRETPRWIVRLQRSTSGL
jgi:hypothetical protein